MKAIVRTQKMTTEDFVLYTIEDLFANPLGTYFNQFQKSDKVYIRKEDNPHRSVGKVLDDIMTAFDHKQQVYFDLTLGEYLELFNRGVLLLNSNDKRLVEEQRGEIKTPAEKSAIVLSYINKDCVAPAIIIQAYYNENNELNIIAADGQQRSWSIIRFLTNELVMKNTNTPLDGHSFYDLPYAIQEAILNISCTFCIKNPVMYTHFGPTFRTINSTQTKMSDGEKANCENAGTLFSKLIWEAIEDKTYNKSVKEFFASATGKANDRGALYKNIGGAIGSYMLYSADKFKTSEKTIPKIIAKTANLRSTHPETGVPFDVELTNLFSNLPDILDNIQRYFGMNSGKCVVFNRKYEPASEEFRDERFPKGYVPSIRNNRVNNSFQAVVFTIMAKLTDENGNCTLSDAKMRQIAKVLDETFSDKNWWKDYIDHKGVFMMNQRMDYIRNKIFEEVGVVM